MRILLISNCLPWPYEVYGAAQRTHLLRQALQAWGDVDIMLARSEARMASDVVQEHMTAAGVVETVAFQKGRRPSQDKEAARAALAAVLERGKYDLIAVRYLRNALRLGLNRSPSVPVIVDLDDIDWLVLRNKINAGDIAGIKALFARAVAPVLSFFWHNYVRRFSHAWVASEEDRAVVRLDTCCVLPNIPLPACPKEAPCAQDCVLLVGLLSYRPNVEGFGRFLQHIWPRVHANHPDLVLRVVGGGLAPEIKEAWGAVAGVELLGYVDDLEPEYARCLFTVAPVYWGGGTKIKVLESLLRGRPVVGTPHALYGFGEHVRDGHNVLMAKNDDEFVKACTRLVSDSDLRTRLSAHGRDLVGRHFSVARFNEVVNATVSRVCSQQVHARHAAHPEI